MEFEPQLTAENDREDVNKIQTLGSRAKET